MQRGLAYQYDQGCIHTKVFQRDGLQGGQEVFGEDDQETTQAAGQESGQGSLG